MKNIHALGVGVGTQNKKGSWLEVFYPLPILQPGKETSDLVKELIGYSKGNITLEISRKDLEEWSRRFSQIQGDPQSRKLADIFSFLQSSSHPLVITLLEEDTAPENAPEAYLKLQLISHRLVKPHDICLDGIFGVLPNVVWTNRGAIDPEEYSDRQLEARVKGDTLFTYSVDKFPKMTDYVIPSGIRIADTARVRLGAYIGEGTTVMHEGFVNFNAGTIGPNMVEGRISAGVVIETGSDLGGGCSTMGTLSGGGNIVISVGKRCLVGANAGLGIPLGNDCTIESGLYLTAGTKVALLDGENKVVAQVKASELADKNKLLFRRNSLSGAVECKTNRSSVELNHMLHQNT